MKKILRLVFWALVALSLYGFMFRSASIVAGLAPTQQQCVGNPDGKCEFNPALSQWLQQTGGKDGLANQSASTPAVTPPAAEANAPDFGGK